MAISMKKISERLHIIEDIKDCDLASLCCEALINSSSVLIKGLIDKEYCMLARRYLSKVGRSSMPEYHPLNEYAPNHYRVNFDDERANVKGWFHQFNIFLHNQDLLNTNYYFQDIFKLKDDISTKLGSDAIIYNSKNPSEEFISRIGFQFYPQGRGYLEEHQDFAGNNQKVVPTLIMSKKGEDFKTGGFFIEGSEVDIEDFADIGDILIFDPQLRHGVETIDQECKYSIKSQWDFMGRWMAFATTTLKTKRRKN